jgi:hypothetical protein
MALASYSDLQSTVARWLKRGDMTAFIPDFIMLAEASLNRVLNTTQQRTHWSITPTTNWVSLPTDLSKVITVQWNGHPLDFIPESRTATDPSYQMECGYAIQGGKLFLQVPQLGSVLRIEYYQEIESLSNSNTSNWLLEDGPDVYLFATLIQAAMYIRDDDRLQLWTQAYTQFLSDLIANDEDRLIPENSTLVMRAG